jgi:hypothetical protein
MREYKGICLCLPCNERYGDYYNFFTSASREFQDSNDRKIIECPGVTIYDETNTRVVQGVKWHNDRDHSQGYEIVGKQIFAPNHSKTRIVAKENAHFISRCQGCQDFTIRMRIYNQQKDKVDYQQNSPLMPKLKSNFERPIL